MKVIFAQGNPGTQYDGTRHNVGFLLLGALAFSNNAPWKGNNTFNARIAELHIDGEKTLLVQPQSFYNDTGLVARKIIDYYKLNPATDLLVIHDELALPLGTVRVRKQGSPAGNNGIKSINSHLGEQYFRIRVGIWNELRDRMNDADFVLSRFTKNEIETLHTLYPVIEKMLHSFVKGTLENDSHKLETTT